MRKTTRKSIFEIYEPSELKRGHFTDLDNEIRNTDIPERMQLRDVRVTPVPEGSDELDEEADWIYRQAFCRPTISVQDGTDRDRPRKGPQTVGKIKRALDFIRNQNFEVPFIAFYRKEYVLPELNINDLWRVYKFDEKVILISVFNIVSRSKHKMDYNLFFVFSGVNCVRGKTISFLYLKR